MRSSAGSTTRSTRASFCPYFRLDELGQKDRAGREGNCEIELGSQEANTQPVVTSRLT
jgi:hypothetical protein